MKKDKELLEFVRAHEKLMDIDDGVREKLRQEKADQHKVGESYPYIPFTQSRHLYRLFSGMKSFFKQSGGRFLDVGCGTGVIVKMAKDFGLKAQGIEFHKPYLDAGKEFFGLTDEDIILANAFDLDEKFVQSFDVIYTYMPLCNPKRMGELHMGLYHKCDYGQIMVEMYPIYYPVNHYRDTPPYVATWIPRENPDTHPYMGFAVIPVRSSY